MKISATTSDEFKEQFTTFLNQELCLSLTNIVYFWRVEKPITRVLGESNVLYIGQTSRSFNKRYSGSKDFATEVRFFTSFYQHVMKIYGSISIEIIQSDNPKTAECEALNEYYRNHLERPPLNRSIPQPPKKCLNLC